MKKKLSVVVLVCIIFSLLCGCTVGTPEFLPGEQEGDENYVWVCKEPFAYFTLVNKTEDEKFYLKVYNDYSESYASPSFKACFENECDYTFFYASYNARDGRTTFYTPGLLDEYSAEEYFFGSGDYRKDYFDFEVEHQYVDFSDGELTTLRFDKITKEEFCETYGEERYNLLIEEEEKYDETKPLPEFLPGQYEGDENYVWVCKEPFAYLCLAPDEEETSYAYKSFFENEDGCSFLYIRYDRLWEEMSFSKPPSDDSAYSQLCFKASADFYEDYFDLEIVHRISDIFDEKISTLRFEKMTKEEFRETYGEERFNRIMENEAEGI